MKGQPAERRPPGQYLAKPVREGKIPRMGIPIWIGCVAAVLADETVHTLQDELQGRFNRNQMASGVRAAYNEAQ